MYKISLFLLGVLWLASCKKENNEGRAETLLTIDSTSAPETAAVNQAINIRVRATGVNGCYRFERMRMDSTGLRQYAVRAIGSVSQATGACPQVIYRIDTAVNLTPRSIGQHIIRYYNAGDALFQSDSIMVN